MPRIGHRPMYGLMPMLGAKQVAVGAVGAVSIQIPQADLAITSQAPVPVVPYIANTARFESASTEYMSAAISPADSNSFTLSFWLRRLTAGVAYLINTGPSGNVKFSVRALSGNTIRCVVYDTSNTLIGSYDTTSTFTVDGSWHHYFISFDNTVNGSELLNIYVDGSPETPVSPTFGSNTAVWFARAGPLTTVGRDPAGASYYDGCFSEIWLSTEYVDPASYISNFISGGKPVNLGANGSSASPSARQPEIYLKDANTSFGTNYGSLGNLTPTGTLSDCASGPSD